MKHSPQKWRVLTMGILLLSTLVSCGIFVLVSKTIALYVAFFGLGLCIAHGITITEWKATKHNSRLKTLKRH